MCIKRFECIPLNSGNLFLGIWLGKVIIHTCKDSVTSMLIIALFIIVFKKMQTPQIKELAKII